MKQIPSELAGLTWPMPKTSVFGRTWPAFSTWVSVAHLVSLAPAPDFRDKKPSFPRDRCLNRDTEQE